MELLPTFLDATVNQSDKQHPDLGRTWRGALLALLLLPMSGAGQDDRIYRCPQADGTVAFQELPCPEPADTSNDDSRTGRESNGNEAVPPDSPADEFEESSAPAAPPSPIAVSKERAQCEKRTRDAIDAIDDELRKNRSGEARETYLGELLELTRQLRACKQL